MGVLTGPWSHSRASSCSLALYKEKVLKAPPEPRPERLMAIDRRDLGSCLHVGQEEQLKAVVKGRAWLDTKTLARKLVGDAEFSHLGPEVDEIERRMNLFRDRFRVDRDMELAERDARIVNNMLGSEMRIAIDGQGNPSSFKSCPVDGWRGIVDYAEDGGDGTLIIIDSKNRPAIHNDSELLTHEQLSGYIMLVASKFPGQFTKFIVGIYYFEFGYTQLVDITWEQVRENWRKLQARATHKESLAEDRIQAEPGWGKCQYCDYLESCSAGRVVMEPGLMVPTDAESALVSAKWLMVTEEKIKAVRTALRAFTQEYGPVILDDETGVGYSVSGTVDYDKAKLLPIIKTLVKEGKVFGSVSDYVNINKTAINKAAKNEYVHAALEVARIHGTKTDFKIFRSRKRVGVKISSKNVRAGKQVTNKRSSSSNPTKQRKVSGRVKSGARSKKP